MTKNKLLLFFPFIFSLVIIANLAYQSNNQIIQPIDDLYPLSTLDVESKLNFMWDENNYGSVSFVELITIYPRYIGYFLLKIGVSAQYSRLIFILIYLNGTFYTSFYFIRKSVQLFYKNLQMKPYTAMLGAIFYTYGLQNLLFLSGGLAYSLIYTIITSPIIVYLLLKSIQNRTFKNKDILLLGAILGLGSNSIHFAIATYICFLFSYLITDYSNLKNNVFAGIKIICISLLSGAIFIITLGVMYANLDKEFLQNSLSGLLFSNKGLSGFIRFFFNWTIGEKFNGVEAFQAYNYYNSTLVTISIFILWAIILLVLSIQTKKAITYNKSKIYIFLLTMIVVSFLLGKGNQPPFETFNMILYNKLSIMGLLRTPDTKFGLTATLAISILIAITFEYFKNKYVKMLIIFCVLTQTGGFLIPQQFYGVPQRSTSFILLNDYMQIINYLNNDSGNGSILIYPTNEYGNYIYPPMLYEGWDLLERYLTKPVIYVNHAELPIAVYKKLLYFITFASKENPGNLGIKYILIRNDLQGTNITNFKNQMDLNNNIKKIFENHIFTLYQTNEHNLHYPVEVVDSTGRKIDAIKVMRINPTKYHIYIPNSLITSDEININFLTRYSNLWTLSSSNKYININHNKLNDFANNWDIKCVNPSKCRTTIIELTLSNKLQNIYIYSAYLSFATLICLSIIIIRIEKKQ